MKTGSYPENITSADYITGQPERFEPKERVFVTTNATEYGVIPYLDHWHQHYYFLLESIDCTTCRPRVVLNLTEEAFADRKLVELVLIDALL